MPSPPRGVALRLVAPLGRSSRAMLPRYVPPLVPGAGPAPGRQHQPLRGERSRIPPGPGTVADRPRRRLLRASRHRAASPRKECRTESPCRTARRSCLAPPRRPSRPLRADWFGIAACVEMLRLSPSQGNQVAANSDPQPQQSPRQPLQFVPAVVTAFASNPDPKKCSAAVKARSRGEPCPPPKAVFTSLRRALIAARARDQEMGFERSRMREAARRKGTNALPSQPLKTPSRESPRQRTQARVRDRVPPSAESGRPGGAGWRVGAVLSGLLGTAAIASCRRSAVVMATGSAAFGRRRQ